MTVRAGEEQTAEKEELGGGRRRRWLAEGPSLIIKGRKG